MVLKIVLFVGLSSFVGVAHFYLVEINLAGCGHNQTLIECTLDFKVTFPCPLWNMVGVLECLGMK